MHTSSIKSIRGHKDNPRSITPQKFAYLANSLKSFGDMGGVVANVRSGEPVLVSGHQRMEAFKASTNAELHITLRYQNPTNTGTVAEGYLQIDGERFSYRETSWDASTHKAASIAANNAAGAWEMGGLTSWLNELNANGYDLSLTMMSEDELAPYLPSADEASPDEVIGEASQGEDFDPETGEVPEGDNSRTQQVQLHDTSAGQVKVVQLFFDAETHKKFLEITDVLKQIYGKDNLSEAVFEAVQRASISSALT